jgi:hypothetical protein
MNRGLRVIGSIRTPNPFYAAQPEKGKALYQDGVSCIPYIPFVSQFCLRRSFERDTMNVYVSLEKV